MIAPDSTRPSSRFQPQALQECGGVGDIIDRLDSFLDRLKYLPVIFQINLHATQVDIADSEGLQAFYLSQVVCFGADKFFLAPGSDCLGPGKGCLCLIVPAAGFGQGYGMHQKARKPVGDFRRMDGSSTNSAEIHACQSRFRVYLTVLG